MYILGFETTGVRGSVALCDLETKKIREKSTKKPMEHLKNITELASELLREEGIKPSKLSAVAASIGPGSYTGIRIGVSSARAVAQALDIRCLSVPSLEMFREKCDGRRGCAVIVNARRGQVYGAVYGSCGEEILAPGAYMLKDVTSAVDAIKFPGQAAGSRGKMSAIRSEAADICAAKEKLHNIVFYGDGVTEYLKDERFAHLLQGRTFAEDSDLLPTAGMVVRYALKMWERGETCEFADLLPEYMRETEAEQKLKDGTLAKLRAKKMESLMGGHK